MVPDTNLYAGHVSRGRRCLVVVLCGEGDLVGGDLEEIVI